MSSLTVNIANPSAPEALDLLQIEQEDWGEGVGYVSKVMAMSLIINMFMDVSQEIQTPVCGIEEDGTMQVIVNVYPLQRDLNYKLLASYGSLSSKTVDVFDYQELLIFNGTSSGSLRYHSLDIKSAEWEGDVFGDGGDVITPSFDIDGDNVTVGSNINGVLLVEYTVERHQYTLSVAPRDDAEKSKYSATVYGLYEGGLSYRELTQAPGADEYNIEIGCSGSIDLVSIQGREDKPYEPPTAEPKDRQIVVDYCSQVVISDTIT